MDFYNIGVSREKRRRVNFIDADRLFRMQSCKLEKKRLIITGSVKQWPMNIVTQDRVELAYTC